MLSASPIPQRDRFGGGDESGGEKQDARRDLGISKALTAAVHGGGLIME
jgi:hypothetical protein